MGDTCVSAGQLRAFIERIERLEAEVKDLNADKSDIYKEAKASGFDVKAMRVIVAERRQDPDKLQELDAMIDLYRGALTDAPRAGAREGGE
jgi:uncharacterized protein (UPF0335 family)